MYHNNCKLSNVYAHRLTTLLCPDGNEIIYSLTVLLNVMEHGRKMQLISGCVCRNTLELLQKQKGLRSSLLRNTSC